MLVQAVLAALVLARPAPPVPAGEDTVVIDTSLGAIRVQLLAGKAPRHVENFRKLAREGFYDGTTFHRVIPGYIVQGGSPTSRDADPRNDNFGGPGYTVKAEFNDLLHERGALAMARDVSHPDSAGSQFFIVLDRATNLDAIRFTIFGKVTQGMELLDKIAAAPRDEENYDRPLAPVLIKKVSLGAGAVVAGGAEPVAAAAAAGPAVSAAAPALPGGAGKIKITAPGLVNVRQGPGTDKAVAQRLPSGTVLGVKSRQGDWVGVELAGGKTGWIRQDMVAPAP